MKEKSPDMEPSWLEVIGGEFEKPYMAELRRFLVEEMRSHNVYPPGGEMFRAFWKTPFHCVRVVILGQDPYHGLGQAHGLSFSVPKGITKPPSLRNIFKERQSDVGLPIPEHGDLSSWSEKGVLLLNTVLSVRHRMAHSHKGKGWEVFTDRVIEELDTRKDGLVFVLWGAHAGKKAQMIDPGKHLVIRSPHPSPFSADRGFFGSKPFSRINKHLQDRDEKPIEWQLTN